MVKRYMDNDDHYLDRIIYFIFSMKNSNIGNINKLLFNGNSDANVTIREFDSHMKCLQSHENFFNNTYTW